MVAFGPTGPIPNNVTRIGNEGLSSKMTTTAALEMAGFNARGHRIVDVIATIVLSER